MSKVRMHYLPFSQFLKRKCAQYTAKADWPTPANQLETLLVQASEQISGSQFSHFQQQPTITREAGRDSEVPLTLRYMN